MHSETDDDLPQDSASTHGALPVYIQIAELISRQISAGHLLDGQRLPTEKIMAREYGVAVGTLRKSLARLVELGLLVRRQGSGNYIQRGEHAASIYSFFRLELPTGGGLPSANLLSVATLAKPDGLPDFGLDGAAHVDFAHRFRRVRFLDGDAVALEEIWLDGSVTPKIDPAAVSQSLYEFYKSQLGIWITRAEDWVSIDALPDWAADQFHLPAGTMVGYVERFGWSQTNNKVEFSRTWFDHNAARYVARLK